MKKDLTELVFILDRSGSMSGLETDTIGGFNNLITKQKHEAGEAIVTTVLFDDKYEILSDRADIKGVQTLTGKDYYVRGSTALLDAVGKTVSKISNAQKHTSESQRPKNTLVVITTDGYENSSCEYSYKTVREMIEDMKKKYGWEFIFMGANIDSVSAAKEFGINEEYAVNYNADKQGTKLTYEAIDSAVSEIRNNNTVSAAFRANVDEDYLKRNK